MADQPVEFEPQSTTPSGVERNHALLADLAASMRRLVGKEDYDAKSVRTVWHRGKRAELLSWEHKDGTVMKQELTLLGLIVEYKHPMIIRTGKIPHGENSTGPGGAASHLIKLDQLPAQQTLAYASHFLKNVPDRDYYAQHLLKHVNEALAAQGFDAQTSVSQLSSFSRLSNEVRKATEPTETAGAEELPRRWPPWAIAGAAVAVIVVITLAGYLLLRVR
jgi:hypothetical protein